MPDETNHYGATAAREHGRPGRDVRPRSITIDMHSHVMVPEAFALTQPHVDLTKVPLAHFATDNTKALNRKQDADRRPNMVDLAVRLADMDAAGIDLQVIMPPPPQCTYSVPLDLGIKAARIVIAGMASFAAQKPERFTAIGTVPMQDGKAAAAELERSMREDGLKGAQILTSVNGLELSDPQFAPFWEKAEELGAVILIHPNGFTEAGRMTRFYFNNVIGNPLETTLALHYLIFDGVLERYPGLKLIAVHGGGYLAGYSGRIDHAYGARSDVRGTLPQLPTTYLKRVFFDSVVFTPHQLRHLVEVFGADKILMGTDYPYDMAESDPVGHLAESGLDEATFAKIAGGNAKTLFGL
jgi:aminocarboxymuconate-semialdehyde decarboxylase